MRPLLRAAAKVAVERRAESLADIEHGRKVFKLRLSILPSTCEALLPAMLARRTAGKHEHLLWATVTPHWPQAWRMDAQRFRLGDEDAHDEMARRGTGNRTM